MIDDFGDRMKVYEELGNGRLCMPQLPVFARLDGRAFHTFCKGLKKPFDEKFISLMAQVAKYLVDETHAVAAYHQSDEITLLWYQPDPKSQIFFNGRIKKMTSTLAAMASAKLNQLLPEYLPEKAHLLPIFDCRVFQVPTLMEMTNVFLWREQDALRNSIQAAAQSFYSGKELLGKSQKVLKELLRDEQGVIWQDYPHRAKRGAWVRRAKVIKAFSTEDLSKLPAKHNAHRNPELKVERYETQVFTLEKNFGQLFNPIGVLLDGEIPIYKEDATL